MKVLILCCESVFLIKIQSQKGDVFMVTCPCFIISLFDIEQLVLKALQVKLENTGNQHFFLLQCLLCFLRLIQSLTLHKTFSGSVLVSYSRGPGLEPHWTLWVFFMGVSLGKTLQSPSVVKFRKDMNNVICHQDVTEILLKAA